jgi:N-acetylglucosamine-6-phosphate deacetylase
MMILKNFRFCEKNVTHGNVNLLIKKKEIASISTDIFSLDEEIFDCKNYYMAPGLVDLQTFGAAGIIFENELSLSSLRTIGLHHLHRGTTSFLITLPCTSLENIFKAIEIVKAGMQENLPGLIGLHLEGPFISPMKRGVHNPSFILSPTREIIEKIIDLGHGIVKMITIAPEIFSEELLQLMLSSDMLIAAGHSNATFREAQLFFDKGIHCGTHLYNAMSQCGSREAGLVGAILENDKVWSTIVVDGKHICYETLKITFRLKKDKLILISDVAFLDIKEDKTSIGGIEVIRKDGAFYTHDGRLAGSSIAVLDAVKNVHFQLNEPLSMAIAMGTLRPAELINIKAGKIEEGSKADLIFLDEALQLKGIISEGKWVKKIV